MAAARLRAGRGRAGRRPLHVPYSRPPHSEWRPCADRAYLGEAVGVRRWRRHQARCRRRAARHGGFPVFDIAYIALALVLFALAALLVRGCARL